MDMHGEMEDRFGPIPEALTNLLQVLRIKQMMRQIGIERIETMGDDLVFSFYPKGSWKPEGLVSLIQQDPNHYHFQGEGKLCVSFNQEKPDLTAIQGVMDRFNLLVTV